PHRPHRGPDRPHRLPSPARREPSLMPHPGPSTVGRYELRSRLGAGGMGTVWRAWDPSLRRDVAIKEVLLPSGMTPQEQTEAHQRTLREAQATARINPTAVVTIHDVLEHDTARGSSWNCSTAN